MSDKVLSEFKQRIHSWKLLPDRGGCFEITVDGELIHSKLETGSFPNEQDIIRELRKRVKK